MTVCGASGLCYQTGELVRLDELRFKNSTSGANALPNATCSGTRNHDTPLGGP